MLAKHYNPAESEPRSAKLWQELGCYHFELDGSGEVFSIDTPPPTVSGNLHLGHIYSYSHADFVARFWRMNGRRVFYPMGYDDNGLPTERLVEKRLGTRASEVSRSEFIRQCLQVSAEAEQDYQRLWQRLGLSIDWRYTYRTIDARSQRIAQYSFIDLVRKGLAYQRRAPAIWCPECRTSLAQADLNDLERQSEFVSLPFIMDDGFSLAVATTRPELLPACVAIFVHPQDERFVRLVGQQARVPLFGQLVPVLADPAANPSKGTGVVMCCTFGDSSDVTWWYTHQLPLIETIEPDGRLGTAAGRYSGLSVEQARVEIVAELERKGLILARQPTTQAIRVHERCDTPVEYNMARQWFIRVLEHKARLIQAGEQIRWQPEHMLARYRSWVENLNWDWCISRQRYYGVPFPLWYCQECGAAILADESRLPVDPAIDSPSAPCSCGSTSFIPETDFMDTWATSSMTPQIVGGWLESESDLYQQVFPFSLRPQAHEIIRTWAFYTILKAQYHSSAIPWTDVLISGWGIAGEGMGKISKSRGGGPLPPMEMIERYSADAVRYWAASTSPGKDAVISEEKIQLGARLATKLWNVARFSEQFLSAAALDLNEPSWQALTPADRWILSSLAQLVERATQQFQVGEYAAAKSDMETFFWRNLCDNYLEMCKQRLYDPHHAQHSAAVFSLYQVISTVLKLFAPILPFVTEEIYQGLFSKRAGADSIHTSSWPAIRSDWIDEQAIQAGEQLVAIATGVRRYKSERGLPLGSELPCLRVVVEDPDLAEIIRQALPDLSSVSRARLVEVLATNESGLETIWLENGLSIQIESNIIG